MRKGRIVASEPHGPYSASELARAVEKAAIELRPGESRIVEITGGNGVGYPGYYPETVEIRHLADDEYERTLREEGAYKERLDDTRRRHELCEKAAAAGAPVILLEDPTPGLPGPYTRLVATERGWLKDPVGIPTPQVDPDDPRIVWTRGG